jgi:hypothetical protein
MSIAVSTRRRHPVRAVLLMLTGAIAFVLFSPHAGPATAHHDYEYTHACFYDYSHPPVHDYVGAVDGVTDYAAHVWVQPNNGLSDDGQVGVCVSPAGGQYIGPLQTGDVLFGVGVGGNLVGGDPSMTGVLVQPQVCYQADDPATIGTIHSCITGGTTGAEADTSGGLRVCVAQMVICGRLN